MSGPPAAPQPRPLIGRHPFLWDDLLFWGKGISVVLVVQLLGVLEIDLENVVDLSVWSPPLDLVKRWKDKTPCEIANRERLTHGQAVEINRVVIHDVARLLLGVVVA